MTTTPRVPESSRRAIHPSTFTSVSVRSPQAPAGLDGICERVVTRLPLPATATLIVLLLASWLPHYVTWPWWPDLDTHAALALAWAEGVRPYQDITAYTFPGQIYVFAILHRLFGPGRTWTFYAFDAGLVLAFGLALLVWSGRRFGGVWPGLLGFAAFLSFYLNLNFALVAQRDWQATCFVVFSLLAPTTVPGRVGRTASALAIAAALAFRPHVVLFGPALLVAIVEGARAAGERRPWRSVWLWLGTAGIATLVVFAPLLVQGLLDDLVRNLRLASHGSAYSRSTTASAFSTLIHQLIELRWSVVPLLLGLVALRMDGPLARETRIWLLAALGVLFYKPLHPFPHDYLNQPRWVVWSVLLALLGAAVIRAPGLSGRLRLAAALGLLAAAVPEKPAFCAARASVNILGSTLRGGEATPTPHVPPGYVHHMTAYQAELYPWEDYQAALVYLREELGPETRVANLMGYQLGAVGASGRLPVFLNESGLLWKGLVGWDERIFIDQLEAAADSVVIWTPSDDGPEPGLVTDRIKRAVERWYEPAASFGVIEIRRRRDEAPAPQTASEPLQVEQP